MSRAGPPEHRETWVEIDLDAISANVAALRAFSRAPHLAAIVKADAYGHGMVPAARAAVEGGATHLGVALVEEGVALRTAGVGVPIIVLSEPPAAAIPELIDAQLTPAVYSAEFVHALDQAAFGRNAGPVPVHLKLDTGMHRVGVPRRDWEQAFAWFGTSRGVRCDGVFSHLAQAEEPEHPHTVAQVAAFAEALDGARAAGLDPGFAHLCNSAGTFNIPDAHYDLVRPGLAVYGLSPIADPPVALRPALSWYSRAAFVKILDPGSPVGYGMRWTAPGSTTLATVPAGYADGVPRSLTNVGQVVCRGRRLPMVGTISMDSLTVDAGPADEGDAPLAVGDEVVLLGRDGDVAVTADDWARWTGTISYEIVTRIGMRVPRMYTFGGA